MTGLPVQDAAVTNAASTQVPAAQVLSRFYEFRLIPEVFAADQCVALGGSVAGDGKCHLHADVNRNGTYNIAETLVIDSGVTLDATYPKLIGGTGNINVGGITLNISGNLVMESNSQIICNDQSTYYSFASGASACPITINASGNMEMKSGSAIYAENRNAGGNGAQITVEVGGDLTLRGGAIISSSKTSGGGDTGVAGNISIKGTGANSRIVLETGSKVLANGTGTAGTITITSEHSIAIDGLVSSAGSTTLGRGMPITIDAVCDLTISDTGTVSSRGQDPGADLVHLEGGCSVTIFGLVESTGVGHTQFDTPRLCHSPTHPDKPSESTACVEVWAGDSLTIDSTGGHKGQVNADTGGSGGSTGTSWIDLFARGDITVTGNPTGTFAVHANGNAGTNDNGGIVTTSSTQGRVKASGLAIQASALGGGGDGGTINVNANLDVDLTGGTLQARGATSGTGPSGGTIVVRSFNANIASDTNSLLDVIGGNPNPTGGAVTLTACGTIGFPLGTVTPVTPTKTYVCGGAPVLPSYVTLPLCLCNTVEGDKFEDADADGQPWETGETKLSGWTIRLYDASGSLVGTKVTDSNGHYKFDGLASGTYKVCEVLASSDWVQTYPKSPDGVACSVEGTRGWSVTVSSGSSITGKDFGNFKKASPTIETLLSATVISIGGKVSDSATLTGATSDAGGSVTYSVYDGGTCSGGALDTSVVIVANGVVPDSELFDVFDAAGTYSFQAVYTGDQNNNGATSVCTTEVLTVEQNEPSIATLLPAGPFKIGDTVSDSASLTGATSDAGGSVTYSVYDGGTCSGGALATSVVTVTGGVVPPSDEFDVFDAAGTYSFQAVYTGDPNNKGATSDCSDEVLTVGKASPSIVTSVSPSPITLDGSATDTATLSGGVNPTGSITFKVYSTSDCSDAGVVVGSPVTVNGNGPYTSDAFTPSAAGTYYWVASYVSGDSNNNDFTTACGADGEVLTVEPRSGQPSISTTLSALEPVTVGTAVTDSATLSSVTAGAGGNIVFKVFSGSDDTCSLSPLFTSDPIGVSGPGTYGPSTPNFVPGSVGTYRWKAFYSGDLPNNNPAESLCSEELLTVEPPSGGMLIVTVLDPSTITLGGSVVDTAILSGGDDPASTITFYVYGPSDTAVCTGTPVFTSTVTVDHGNGDYKSGSFAPSAAGKYWWVASFSGDDNNDPISDACGNELLTVEPPSGQEKEMPPVGGEVYSINKLALLSPYLASLALLGAVGVAFLTRRRREA